MGKYTSANLTDEKLLELVRMEEDRNAFAELYERYWDKLFIIADNALKSPEEAEECVQDIFCSLWNRRLTLQLRYSLYTYLAVAVKYQVIRRLDKKHRLRQIQQISFAREAEVLAPSTEEILLEKELFARLEQAVCMLPEKCQIVFRMSREDGKTHKQIAAELGISERTVNNHLTKALNDLNGNLTISSVVFVLGLYLRH